LLPKREAQTYTPLIRGELHKNGQRRRHRAYYGSHTEHGMMVETAPTRSVFLKTQAYKQQSDKYVTWHF